MLLRTLLLAAAGGATAFGAAFSDLHFFGDSLSDTGNILALTSIVSPLTLGFIPVQPVAPFFPGRFSNGPIWVEQVSQRLGNPAAAAHGGMYLGILGALPGPGNNYAIGGARTLASGSLGAFNGLVPTGVAIQTLYHLAIRGGTADPHGLYFLSGGGNDLRDASKLTDAAQRQAAAEAAADFLAQSLVGLYLTGARKFVLSNAPNVGNTPEAALQNSRAIGREVTTFFNNRLQFYANIP
jgi:outer membrane lipase/esterase